MGGLNLFGTELLVKPGGQNHPGRGILVCTMNVFLPGKAYEINYYKS